MSGYGESVRTGSQWLAEVVARRGRVVGGLGVRLLCNWVRHHPWEAGRARYSAGGHGSIGFGGSF